MVNRSRVSRKGKARKADDEDWSPSKSSRSPRAIQQPRFLGRPNYAEDSDSEDDLSIDESRSTPRPGGGSQLISKKQLKELQDLESQLAIAKAVYHQSEASKSFKSFPVELHQAIAQHLPTDRDAIRYKQICKDSNNAIGDSFWRAKFLKMFDRIHEIDGETPTAAQLAAQYKLRRNLHRNRICFDFRNNDFNSIPGFRERQMEYQPLVLGVLKDMIIQSDAHLERNEDDRKITVGLNHDYIRDWVYEHRHGQPYLDIIDAVMKTSVGFDPASRVTASSEGSLIMVIQLSLASLVLDYNVLENFPSFHQSQVDAYADRTQQPLFVGKWKQDVNVKWALSTLNFFSFHLNMEYEGVLNPEYWDLKKDQIAHPWTGKLEEGTQTLGSKWKAAYTYLNPNDLYNFRTGSDDDDEEDRHVDEFDPLADIALIFNEANFSSEAWPKGFERLIETNPYHEDRNLTPTRGTRRTASPSAKGARQYEFKSFYGSTQAAPGICRTHYYGRVHGLPPQQGIPGFQRTSFLRFQEGDPELQQIWGYEGLICPGNNVIVGRWWHIIPGVQVAPVDEYSGPFVFWNVDGCLDDVAISTDVALKHLDTLRADGMVI